MNSLTGAIVVALIALLSYSPKSFSDNRPVLAGRVIKVIDGDTIDVQLQSGPIRIRFYGVDAPEKSQDHGKEAATALSSLILGKDVQIEPFQQDRYDRLVGNVYLGKLNVNAELVRKGDAWAMRRYMRKSDAALCSLEANARLNRRGLWASPEPVAPWTYRGRSKYLAQPIPETIESCVAAIGKPY